MQRWLAIMAGFFWSIQAMASLPDFNEIPGDESEFLPVAQAFSPSTETSQEKVSVTWKIAPGYYLYKSRIRFEGEKTDLEAVNFDRTAEKKNDPNFGLVEIFHDQVTASARILKASAGSAVIVHYQGCAQAGLCYPPQTLRVALQSPDKAPQPATKAAEALTPASKTAAAPTKDLNSASGIAGFLEGASLWMVVGTFLILGIGLSFTPCVLPMVPILSGIIAGQGEKLTARRGLALSSAYVIGMATTYAVAGTAVGYFGASANIGAWMQNPWALSVFAALFVLLALSMFGFYDLRLPAFIQDRLSDINQKQEGGNLIGVLLMGVLSALVVSPCVSAPLAGALLYISGTGNALLGGLALLALGLGMGVPLLLIGVGGGSLIPKAGEWMLAVKALFGVLLLGVAAWMLSRFVNGSIMMLIWSLLLLGSGVAMGAADQAAPGWPRVWKAAGIALVSWAILMLIGLSAGNANPLAPLKGLGGTTTTSTATTAEVAFHRIHSSDELDRLLEQARQENKPAVLDFYADWCVSCVEMAHGTFRDPAVIEKMKGFVTIQADITSNDADAQALLKRFGLFGPPSVIFFDSKGAEIRPLRLMGEAKPEAFIKLLQQAN